MGKVSGSDAMGPVQSEVCNDTIGPSSSHDTFTVLLDGSRTQFHHRTYGNCYSFNDASEDELRKRTTRPGQEAGNFLF